MAAFGFASAGPARSLTLARSGAAPFPARRWQDCVDDSDSES
jgi:hypothetical protein